MVLIALFDEGKSIYNHARAYYILHNVILFKFNGMDTYSHEVLAKPIKNTRNVLAR